MVRSVLVAGLMASVVSVAMADDDHHHHAGDIVVAATSAGQLTFEYEHDHIHAELEPATGGWSGYAPGFDHLGSDEPADGLYALLSGADVYLDIVDLDAGVRVFLPGVPSNIEYGVGEQMPLGGYDLHSHALWVIDESIVGQDFAGGLHGQFRLVDQGATGYADSDVFEIHFEAVPEPATLGLMTLGGLVAARRRRT